MPQPLGGSQRHVLPGRAVGCRCAAGGRTESTRDRAHVPELPLADPWQQSSGRCAVPTLNQARAPGQRCGRPLMNIRSCASVIAMGIGVLRLTTVLAHAGPGDGQDAPSGNAMNPRGVNAIVERDPEGLGIGENSRSPTGLLTASPVLV